MPPDPGRGRSTVHTGDFTAASVLADLERFGPVVAVHGNMDDGALRRALPVRTTVELEGRIGLVHDGGPAVGRHERLRELSPAATSSPTGTATCRRSRGLAASGSSTQAVRRKGGALPSTRWSQTGDGEPELIAVQRMTSDRWHTMRTHVRSTYLDNDRRSARCRFGGALECPRLQRCGPRDATPRPRRRNALVDRRGELRRRPAEGDLAHRAAERAGRADITAGTVLVLPP